MPRLKIIDELLKKQPIFGGAKIDLDPFYANRYSFALAEETLQTDLDFLRDCSDLDIIADIFPKNKYSEFGFGNLSSRDFSCILELVKRAKISISMEHANIVEKTSHLQSLQFHGGADEFGKTNKNFSLLNLENLTHLSSLSLPVDVHSASAISFSDNVNLKELTISHLSEKGKVQASLLDGLKKLRILDLFRYKYKSFYPIAHLANLKLLICTHSSSLVDVSALENFQSLKRIDFEDCSNLPNLDVLSELPQLRILRLNNCHSIPSLSFLKGSNVECLEFVNTALKDSDLSFLSDMQNLKVVRYSNKQSYNIQREDTLISDKHALWKKFVFSRDDYLNE